MPKKMLSEINDDWGPDHTRPRSSLPYPPNHLPRSSTPTEQPHSKLWRRPDHVQLVGTVVRLLKHASACILRRTEVIQANCAVAKHTFPFARALVAQMYVSWKQLLRKLQSDVFEYVSLSHTCQHVFEIGVGERNVGTLDASAKRLTPLRLSPQMFEYGVDLTNRNRHVAGSVWNPICEVHAQLIEVYGAKPRARLLCGGRTAHHQML